MLSGMFKTFEELEESLTVEELHKMIEAIHEKEFRGWKFQAGLKGIDLDAEVRKEKGSSFDKIKERAQARLAGATEENIEEATEEMKLADFGIKITKE